MTRALVEYRFFELKSKLAWTEARLGYELGDDGLATYGTQPKHEHQDAPLSAEFPDHAISTSLERAATYSEEEKADLIRKLLDLRVYEGDLPPDREPEPHRHPAFAPTPASTGDLPPRPPPAADATPRGASSATPPSSWPSSVAASETPAFARAEPTPPPKPSFASRATPSRGVTATPPLRMPFPHHYRPDPPSAPEEGSIR